MRRVGSKPEDQQESERRSSRISNGGGIDVGGEDFRNARGAVVAEAADGESVCGELWTECVVHFHRDEAQLDYRYYSFAQCLRRTSRLLLREDMDQTSGEIWFTETAFHSPGEHRDSDLCCRFLRHRLQRYAPLILPCTLFPASYLGFRFRKLQ